MGGVLVIGYGSTLRGDDGIGPAVANEVAELGLPGVRVLSVHQLTPELAAHLAGARLAVFVDASVTPEPVMTARLDAQTTGPVMTHAADPRGLLAFCQAVYGRSPEAWLVTAAGTDFGFRDGLSEIARENARAARREIERLIRSAG